MSTAHRPTWEPARARADSSHLSAQVARHNVSSYTKLKIRAAPVPDAARPDVRRDLRAELEAAERAATNAKRIANGLPPLPEHHPQPHPHTETERLKVIEDARDLDRDQDQLDSQDSDSDDDDDDDDDDDTDALMRELEKIKAERAKERAALKQLQQDAQQSQREDQIALGNPLLNLEHAMGATTTPARSASASAAGAGGGDFGVKRRWDDDLIFKNQAAGAQNGADKRGFVNDLTRSEFHRKFISRYIK